MATLASKTVNGHLVYYESGYAWRWFELFGPNAVKVLEEFQATPFASADNMAAWTTTLVEGGAGDTTVALVAGSATGELLITTDAAENDGANIQLTGETFYFASAHPAYFGIRFKANEATQSDFLFGWCITDTDLLGGMTDGMYFRKVDGSTDVSFVAEKDSVETACEGLQTFTADTYHIYEIYWDGATLTGYINGVAVAAIAATNANIPDDEYLTPSLHYLTGEAVVHTATVDWIRALQIAST